MLICTEYEKHGAIRQHFGHILCNFRRTIQPSEWVSSVLCLARHLTGHFGDESFQAITCTGTNKQCSKTKHTKQNRHSNPVSSPSGSGAKPHHPPFFNVLWSNKMLSMTQHVWNSQLLEFCVQVIEWVHGWNIGGSNPSGPQNVSANEYNSTLHTTKVTNLDIVQSSWELV